MGEASGYWGQKGAIENLLLMSISHFKLFAVAAMHTFQGGSSLAHAHPIQSSEAGALSHLARQV